MILLSFFFPLAIYLLILGFINRRRHPLLVSGVWDGIGLLFGVSGFLLFAGPAVLSAVSERWRRFWLLGGEGAPVGLDGARQLWIFLSVLYFVTIVGGAALYLWRQRRLTAIYNANKDFIERSVTDIGARLGLNPVRSGGLLLFGSSLGLASKRRGGETAIFSPSQEGPWTESLPLAEALGSDSGVRLEDEGPEPIAILEVEEFPLMRHVTLHWHLVNEPLRRSVESELSRRLSETLCGDNRLSGWLLTVGFILLSFDLAGAFFLFLLLVFRR